MIVDPDFPDHWKTLMLVELLEDPAAPLYVIRIWGHCQMRRQWVFNNLPSSALKALCRYAGHANKLESALVASGYLRRDDAGVLEVCEWEVHNASLVASWANGKKGGRPQKSVDEKPVGIPRATRGEPNPSSLSPLPSSSSSSAEKREPFEQFFDEYPADKRPSATHARLFWFRENLDQHADAILKALRAAKGNPKWVKTYAPRIDRWLEGRPWEAPQAAPEDPRAKRDGESDAEYSLRILKMGEAHAV